MRDDKAKKPVKKIEKRYFTFFGGIAFCLFAVALILNVGYPARAFAFPFTFLFGLGSYAIYIFIYAYGLFLFFREKRMKVRLNNYFFGGLIIFISVLIIATLIVIGTNKSIDINLKNFNNFYINDVFKGVTEKGEVKGYWNASIVNLFKGNNFGGGYVGYALSALLITGLKTAGAWVIALLILLLGAFVIFFPVIRKMMTNGKTKQPKQKKEKPKVSEEYRSIQNVDVISSARIINEVPVEQPKPTVQIEQVGSRPAYNPNPVPNYTPAYGVSGAFAPAIFTKYQIKAQPVMNNVPPQPAPQPAPQQAPQRPAEQMKLDFNKPQELNEALVTAQPVFEEVINAPRHDQQNIQTVSQTVPQSINNNAQQAAQSEQIPPRKPIKWVPPSSELLETIETQDAIELNNKTATERQLAINETFENFHVGAKCDSYVVGPSVTRYNITYGTNVSAREVTRMVDDLAIRLGGVSARFVPVVEGQSYSGLEIPNAKITTVTFKETYESLPDVKKHPLSVGFGKNIDGKVVACDFDEFPHILVAGTTGSGKSIYTHSVVCTLIMRNSPEDLRLVLIDPKKVEMNKYRELPHLLCPIINDANIAKLTLSKLVDEMNRRYEVLDTNGVSNIKQYNELLEDNPLLEKMPYIIVVVDEYADLVDTNKDIGMPVVSIAQKARACGIHMLIATQRPSTNIITGVIKGNLPTRVALAVASSVDSMTIIGEGGAEKLLGRGDMLVQSPLLSRNGCTRLQGCYIQNKEINRVVGYLKEHYDCIYDPNFCNLVDSSAQAASDVIGSPEFQAAQENGEEAKYQSIKDWVMSNEYMSMSRIQRECSVGFNRAGRFFKRLQDEGVIATEVEGNKGCPVLVHDKFFEGSADTDIPVSIDQTD